jgi:hypothetical protein
MMTSVDAGQMHSQEYFFHLKSAPVYLRLAWRISETGSGCVHPPQLAGDFREAQVDLIQGCAARG